MSNKIIYSHAMVKSMISALDDRIEKDYPRAYGSIRVYPVPRGGIPVAYLLSAYRQLRIVDKPESADIFIDDIADSGATCQRYSEKYPGKKFYVGIDKASNLFGEATPNAWIIFPWEQGEKDDDESATDNIRRILQMVGEDPDREGLRETPKRVVKAWGEWTSGYSIDPAEVLKVFNDGGERYDEMVLVKDIPIYSKCEHHLADIFGTCSIAYIPDGKIVGLSKLSRVAEVFARRLQVQERLTAQIADAIEDNLRPKGVGVIIKARHMCMESRGICQQGHHTVTSALRGVLKKDAAARAEFMKLAE